MKLKTDIVSAFNKKIYGKRGDEVSIISDKGNVFIVEAADKNRFAVLKTDVTVERIEIKKEIITVPDATVQHKIKEQVSRKKATPINQTTMF